MSALGAAFADGPAFVPYLVAGDPDIERTRRYVRAVDRGGAAAVELGLPFSEPVAEGPPIQRAMSRSLAGGMTPAGYLDLVERLEVAAALVCMTYYNPIYRFGDADGPAPFVERAAAAGVDGLIVPDLPVEEAGPLEAACRGHGVDLVFIVAPTTTPERRRRIRGHTSGFVYVQARLGTTGARSVAAEAADALRPVAGWDVPAAVGFGIAEPEQASALVEAGADGVIVGSALVSAAAEAAPGTAADRLERTSRAFVGACTRGT